MTQLDSAQERNGTSLSTTVKHMSTGWSTGSVEGQFPESEGASTIDSLICLKRNSDDGLVKRTSLAKRDC